RLGVQAALALAALAALGAIGAEASPFWLPWPLAWIWVVGLTNAFNMLDNMDALSAGTACIICVLSAGLSAFCAGTDAILVYLVLAGALAGFLVYNRPPAKMFMGDAGSTFIGFFLALETLRPTAPADRPMETAGVALCLLAIPLYDMVTVI